MLKWNNMMLESTNGRTTNTKQIFIGNPGISFNPWPSPFKAGVLPLS